MSASVTRIGPFGPGVTRVRSHSAEVRALLDEVERVSHPAVAEQAAEELERLGERLIEVARAILDDARSRGE